MKNINSTFVLILFTWYSCFADATQTRRLPFKVKSYKDEIKFLSRDRFKGYLIDATPNYIYAVAEKSMIEEAVLTDCSNCKRLRIFKVSSIKVKKSKLGALI